MSTTNTVKVFSRWVGYSRIELNGMWVCAHPNSEELSKPVTIGVREGGTWKVLSFETDEQARVFLDALLKVLNVDPKRLSKHERGALHAGAAETKLPTWQCPKAYRLSAKAPFEAAADGSSGH